MKRANIRAFGLVLAGVLGVVQAQKTSAHGLLELTAADSGQPVYVQAGDTIKVTLKGNPTTGYAWYALETDAKYLQLLKKDQQTVNNGMPGGSTQTTVYTYRVLQSLKKGTYTVFTPLAYLYHAPGRGGLTSDQLLEFQVTSR